jgi:hypothetical protein
VELVAAMLAGSLYVRAITPIDAFGSLTTVHRWAVYYQENGQWFPGEWSRSHDTDNLFIPVYQTGEECRDTLQLDDPNPPPQKPAMMCVEIQLPIYKVY